ncbi:hypothetical protein [Embleya sp. NBC_00896]|uniref:hypothetical protein n=1 Tax=Embleya sp. NBC_00896 TaxID=2975961 RepID=UPI00386480F9|nr:hypothetical protein OG928_21705 [Embleya sp. NBC_00896]
MFRATYRPRRVLRTTIAAAAIAGACFATAACEQAQQAISCAELATNLTNDISNLGNVLNDPAAARTSLDNLQKTLDDKTKDLDSDDAKNAANSLSDVITQLSTKAANGGSLSASDVQPLINGAKNLATICVK